MLNRLKELGRSIQREIGAYRRLMRHPRTPRLSRWLLAVAVGYLCMPFDIIPDWIPVLGHVDDVVIVPLLVLWALKRIPPGLLEECRHPGAQAPSTRRPA